MKLKILLYPIILFVCLCLSCNVFADALSQENDDLRLKGIISLVKKAQIEAIHIEPNILLDPHKSFSDIHFTSEEVDLFSKNFEESKHFSEFETLGMYKIVLKGKQDVIFYLHFNNNFCFLSYRFKDGRFDVIPNKRITQLIKKKLEAAAAL